MSKTNQVDVNALAKFFNQDLQVIKAWVKGGMPKEKNGSFDFVKCVRWRIDKLESENNQLQSSDSDRLVSSEYLAGCFGVNERSVQRYAKLDSLPRTAENKYPLIECLRWFIQKLKNENLNLSKDNPLVREKIKTQTLINHEKLTLLMKEAGTLVRADDVEIGWTNLVKIFVSKLEALTHNIYRIVGGDKTNLKKIKDEINDMRNEIAAVKPEQILSFMDDFDNEERIAERHDDLVKKTYDKLGIESEGIVETNFNTEEVLDEED